MCAEKKSGKVGVVWVPKKQCFVVVVKKYVEMLEYILKWVQEHEVYFRPENGCEKLCGKVGVHR